MHRGWAAPSQELDHIGANARTTLAVDGCCLRVLTPVDAATGGQRVAVLRTQCTIGARMSREVERSSSDSPMTPASVGPNV